MKELSINMSAKDDASLIFTKKPNYQIELEIFRDGKVEVISFNQSEMRDFLILVDRMMNTDVENT